MHIAIKNFAAGRRGRFHTARQEVPAGTVVRQVLCDLGIAPNALGGVLLNGCRSHLEQFLYEGDVLSLLPAAGTAAPSARRSGTRRTTRLGHAGDEGSRR